jgi:starvation-inducible DNA-binding protein
MANTNMIGIDADKAAQLADKLNTLLANYQLFYINARGFHCMLSLRSFTTMLS